MTGIEKLRKLVESRYPHAVVSEEHFPSGKTWLDVRLNGAMVVVEHRPRGVYGISFLRSDPASPLEGYGEQPEPISPRYAEAARYFLKLLRRAAGGRRSSSTAARTPRPRRRRHTKRAAARTA